MHDDAIRSMPQVTRRRVLAASISLVATPLFAALPAGAAAQEASPVAPAASPAAAGQTVTVNGASLYYELHGPVDGPPVLLLHGGFGNTEVWASLSSALAAAGFRVVAMDSRGHGRSSWGDLPITYEQMASDALGLLDAIGIITTDLVGWSDGAVIGLELAITHPDRLHRAVLYGANFSPDGAYAEPHQSAQMSLFDPYVAAYERLSPEPGRLGELAEVLFALWATAPNFSEAELASIAVSVLVLTGAEEEFIKPEHTQKLADLIPGAELVVIPGTGHFAPLAVPDEFNRIVQAYLEGQPMATPTTGQTVGASV